jgi:hypothetical protein
VIEQSENRPLDITVNPTDVYDPKGRMWKDHELLEDFYQWAKKVGHYHAYEAVDRYRKSILKEE